MHSSCFGIDLFLFRPYLLTRVLFLPAGTYTNQWQVLDFNHYSPNKGVQAGFFTLLEEVPGTVVSQVSVICT